MLSPRCENPKLRQVNAVNDGDTVFDRCLCVCVAACSGPVNQSYQTSLKRLKLETSNLTSMFVPRDVRTRNLTNFSKRGPWPGSCEPLHFLALSGNSSNMSKATMEFKFDTHVSRDSPDITQKGAWPGSCDPLNFWDQIIREI